MERGCVNERIGLVGTGVLDVCLYLGCGGVGGGVSRGFRPRYVGVV